MANEGARGAGRRWQQIDRMAEFIAACQVGITLTSIGIGFLGEPALAKLIEPVFGGLSHAVAVAISVAFAFLLGHLHPHHVRRADPEAAGDSAGRDDGPATGAAAWRLPGDQRAVRAGADQGRERDRGTVRGPGILDEQASSEDLKIIIAQSQTGGSLDPGEAVMLGGVFHLHEQEAREVMTPIPAVITVNASETVEEALQRCVSSGHTRLIVIEDDNPDRVRGVVHNNSLARLYMNAGPDTSIESAIRDVPIFPETKPLDDLLAELQRQRSSIAVVSDEYGRTVGIVTVEDILEEVVGEIEDETDPRAASMRRLTDGDWYVRGHVSLGDLEDVGIQLPVSSDAFNSIGGYVFSELGRLPKRGDRIQANGYEIRVESVRDNRIVAVRIHPSATGEFPRQTGTGEAQSRN